MADLIGAIGSKRVISKQAIDLLIGIGRSRLLDHPGQIPELESVKALYGINRAHWSKWNEVTRELPVDDLVARVKALPVAERHRVWRK